MTNAVGSIFNESFVEKKRFVGSVNSACDPLEKQKKAGAHSQKKKKEMPKHKRWVCFSCTQTGTK